MIETVEQLDEQLTTPSAGLIEFMAGLKGRMLFIGAGGKMGPTLAVLARRAAEASAADLSFLAASRFSDPASRDWLEQRGIETISTDILDRSQIDSLPDADYVVYLVGLKFGTSSSPSATWVTNTLAPAAVIQRYPSSKIVALSTGNVYPFVDASGAGPNEDHPLTPLGEYPNAAVARERVFEYFSDKQKTPVALLRLNYALDLRYGVLVDIAGKVWNNRPIDLTMGWFNAIWQGDANEMILRSIALAQSPSRAYNLTSLEKYSVRHVAERFGALLSRTPILTGREATTALLSDSRKLYQELGTEPVTSFEAVLEWTADWIRHGRALLGKPTHFETRNGIY